MRAFALLGMPAARLLVLGGASGPLGDGEVARIRALVASLGVADRVTFRAPLPHEAMPAVYRAADVLVVPSRSESFGLVAAEAQACGTPVVAARVGGLAYSVDDGESGFLVSGWDPGDYADPIRRVLEDRALAARLGAGAIRTAEQFSWPATVDRLLELYAGIMDAASRR